MTKKERKNETIKRMYVSKLISDFMKTLESLSPSSREALFDFISLSQKSDAPQSGLEKSLELKRCLAAKPDIATN